MGFLDRFKRKKALLIHEESPVAVAPQGAIPPEQPDLQRTASLAWGSSQGTVPRVARKKRRVKKRKVMKKKVHPRRKTAKRSLQPRSMEMEDGSTTKRWLQKDRELLNQALRDLNRELQSLRSARKRLELKMAAYSSELGSTQDKEISLRNKISQLMKKETALTKKKTAAKDKLASVDQKIEKVRTIQTELKNV